MVSSRALLKKRYRITINFLSAIVLRCWNPVEFIQKIIISTMALKAHFTLLAFIMSTAYTSLHPSSSVRTSQISLSVRTSQRLVCNSQKSTLLWYLWVCTSERSMHTSHLSLSPSKLKDHRAPLKYWCALLKTSTAHFFSIALRTSDISAALFWRNTLSSHFREKLSGLTLFAMGGTSCTRQILLFVVGASGILRKWNFQRTP